MWDVRFLRCLSASVPWQLPLKEFLHPTFTPTPPPLSSSPGAHQSGAMDRWSSEKCSLVPQRSQSLTLIHVCVSLLFLQNRWMIERRVAGTKQTSTVGHVPPDPPPLSFLDSSSALSPWTTYLYRLVLQNRAGNTTGTANCSKIQSTERGTCDKFTCFPLRMFAAKTFLSCRTLGQYHHQTFSASWTESTKGQSIGARVTSSKRTFLS